MRKLTGPSLTLVVVMSAVLSVRAEQVSVTVSPVDAIWSDTVKVRIEGVGCTGATSVSAPIQRDGGGYDIDIDLLSCPVESTNPFSTEVELGPLGSDEYTVRVFNINGHDPENPNPSPLATATLKVWDEASLDVVLPHVATDAAPFKLVFRGTSESPCYFFRPPVVSGNTITARFQKTCTILASIVPTAFEYETTLGPLPAGDYEVKFFEHLFFGDAELYHRTFRVYDSNACVPSPTTLCLQDNRFRAEVNWKDFEGHSGSGHAVPLERGDESGLFWFFQEANIELTAKVLDGCSYNDGWWVFLSSGSTVEYKVTVTDTKTGNKKEYLNALGASAPLVADTAAFSCAP